MKIIIDLRSALVGLVAGVVLMFTLGAAVALPHQVGRYQVTAGGNTGLLIDTVTGQIWSAVLSDGQFGTDSAFKKSKQ